MSVTISKKKVAELSDKESRQFFYEEHIETGLPVQIRELRKKRKMNQTELANEVGCDQSNISDWENPNYEYTPQIGTLKRLANAFDVPLIVRFGSWRELLEWDETLSPEKVAPSDFAEFAKEVTHERLKENEARIAAPPLKKSVVKRTEEATASYLFLMDNPPEDFESKRGQNTDANVITLGRPVSYAATPTQKLTGTR